MTIITCVIITNIIMIGVVISKHIMFSITIINIIIIIDVVVMLIIVGTVHELDALRLRKQLLLLGAWFV